MHHESILYHDSANHSSAWAGAELFCQIFKYRSNTGLELTWIHLFVQDQEHFMTCLTQAEQMNNNNTANHQPHQEVAAGEIWYFGA
jgi:hypothetical protein